MRYVLCVATLLIWSLWFGALCFAMAAANTLFTHAPDIAPRAASLVFLLFERMQVPACLAMLLCAIWGAIRNGGRSWRLFLLGIVLASVLTAISSQWITPKIEAMREQGLTKTPEFRRYHGLSMAVLLGELLLLGGCGMCLPGALAASTKGTPRPS